MAEPPETAASTSVDDEPLAAFGADESPQGSPLMRALVVGLVVVLVAGSVVVWWRQRPPDPSQAAADATAACDAFDAARRSGKSIADFAQALDHSRQAVTLDSKWASLDSSLFSAIDALVFLKKVPPGQTQTLSAQNASVQYFQASQQLADQCALARASS